MDCRIGKETDMRSEWLIRRNELLFMDTKTALKDKCLRLCEDYRREYKKADMQRKAHIAYILKELAIDLGSVLTHNNYNGSDTNELIVHIQKLLFELGESEAADKIPEMIEDISKSNFKRLFHEPALNNYWGNDNAAGLAQAMRKGAVFATTNPPILNNERKKDPKLWDSVKDRIKKDHSQAGSKMTVWMVLAEMVLKNCNEIRPIYDVKEGKAGFVCYQVDPRNSNYPEKMIEEALFVYEYMKGRIGAKPNVSFKLPGTHAGLPAAAALVKKGISVTITLCFSVPQHLSFAKTIETGDSPSNFIVMMSGRLDDPIKDELEELGVKDAANLSRYASEAVIKRSYRELYINSKHEKSALLVASLRGPWNIEAALCNGSVPIYISSFPDKTEEYDSVTRALASRLDEDIPDDVMDELKKSSIFRKAYGIDEMSSYDFDAFYPVRVTHEAFVEACMEFERYVEDDNE